MSAKPQTAIVTGASGGLGQAIGKTLHDKGFRVVLTSRDAAACRPLATRLDPAGDTAVALPLDIGAAGGFEDLLDQVVARWGGAEVLVNCAARTEAKPVLEITDAEFNEVMATNAGGSFSGCRVLGAHFKQRGYGRIINIASLAGQTGGTATGAHYAASKGAILTLTKVFARELAPHGVTVNAVAPGPLDLANVHDLVGAEQMAGFLKNIPTGALGAPDFVAEVVAHLAAPAAGFVTGACWDLNGGINMR